MSRACPETAPNRFRARGGESVVFKQESSLSFETETRYPGPLTVVTVNSQKACKNRTVEHTLLLLLGAAMLPISFKLAGLQSKLGVAALRQLR